MTCWRLRQILTEEAVPKRTTLILLLLSTFSFFAPSGQLAVLAVDRVIMASPSHGFFEFPVVVALRKGFFADEGLDLGKVQMQPQLTVKVLVSGDADYNLSWGSTVRAAATGAPVKAIASLASRPLHILMARPEVKSGKDLKGRTIGVDSVAGDVEYLTRAAARHFGLDPDKDVKIIVTGESPLRLASLRAGAIDATAIDVAYVGKAEEEGLRRLIYLGDIIELPLTGIGVSDSKLAKEREQVKKIIRAALRGTRFMKENRAETIQMMTEYLGITPSQAGRAYDTSISSFTDDGLVSDKGLLVGVQLAKERLKITRDISANQVVDLSLAREIKGRR